jgi:HEAT repeat protein
MGNVAFPPLVRALNDEDVETRYYAAHSLGLMADGKAKIPLIRLAANENEDEDVKRVAKKALCKIT